MLLYPSFTTKFTRNMVNTCFADGCKTRRNFGLLRGKPKWCAKHKFEGDVNVVSKLCDQEGCVVQATHGFPGGKIERCWTHKRHGEVNVNANICEVPMCSTYSRFGITSVTKPMRCSKHKLPGDVRKKNRCSFDGCQIQASFGAYKGKTRSCFKHKQPGDICTRSTRCINILCAKRRMFGEPGGKPFRCRLHRLYTDMKVCAVDNCCNVPDLGDIGELCVKHELTDTMLGEFLSGLDE